MTDVAAEERALAEHGGAEREALVLRLGAAGRGRAQIAAALGMSREQLATQEAKDASLAEALRQAMDLALAWWEAAPLDAYEAGVRFNYGAWGREMRRRFGDAPLLRAQQGTKASSAAKGKTVIYRIPCNGRTKLRPDGTCPCSGYHNEQYWRALDEKDRAENPDDFDDRDDFDSDEEMTDDE